MGAAGKDFHVFNTCYRDREDVNVVGFTAAQIPDIEGREYPAELAGDQYPEGLPIFPESEIEAVIGEHDVDDVIFAYSDVSRDHLNSCRTTVENTGAAFHLAPVDEQYLDTEKPTVTVCAVRTGCGKSQTSRRISDILRDHGLDVGVVRHPMPYGDLTQQRVQIFSSLQDLEDQDCTIEEMEEYEPHINRGNTVYAGVDYEEVLKQAEKDSDVILWDGGNNDTPFIKPDLHIVVCDPLRAGDEQNYYPGWINFERADVLVINKMDTASDEQVQELLNSAEEINPDATIIRADSPISVDDQEAIRGKSVICVEDGPTLTHGDMDVGAAYYAAQRFEAEEVIDPRPYAVGSIRETYGDYPHIGPILPAMGYGQKQQQELEETINASPADLVLMGTPVDLTRILSVEKQCLRVTYELQERGSPNLKDVLLESGILSANT